VHAALYPAAQNLIVAARSLGLGTTFTTFQLAAEKEMRDALELPSDVLIGVCVALGYPDRPFGPVKRKPLAEVIHWEKW
jgi:nitroreductase